MTIKIRKPLSKGFTLIECVVAIAIFAIMTSMVLMILASGVTTTKIASENEEDLNTLVQNVVEDRTVRKFDASSPEDSRVLSMKIGSSSDVYSISYSTIDGDRNFVICPKCGYLDNNVEFMNKAYDSPAYATATDDEKQKYKAFHWFDPATMKYVCPKCDLEFYQTTYTDPDDTSKTTDYGLTCGACGAHGANNDTTKFYFDKNSGGYFCADCGSANVKGDGIERKATTDANFSVTGMTANALKYGDVEEPTDHDSQLVLKDGLNPVSTPDFMFIDYHDPLAKNTTQAGKYMLEFNPQNLPVPLTADGFNITIELPPCYICSVTKLSESASKTLEPGKICVTVIPPLNNDYSNGRAMLYISNIRTGGTSGINDVKIEFTLTNHVSGHNFDDDYENETDVNKDGLYGYYFGGSSGKFTRANIAWA